MGRQRQGFTLRRPSAGSVWYARFTLAGRTVERSTGTRDREAAQAEGARIYADEISREPQQPAKRGRSGSALALEDLVSAWLKWLSTTHAANTLKTWKLYARTHWIPYFGATHNLTQALCDNYPRARLAVVQTVTVRKESTALRSFLDWCLEMGAIPAELKVPALPKRATGKPHKVRRRSKAVALSDAQVEAFLAELPEWSTSRKVERFPIRARFVVAYETSLRPSTLDRLVAPTHFRKGSTTILLTPELDKNRWARELPLSETARAALDRVCPDEGPIFGEHRYVELIREAAKDVLPPERWERFTAAHLRSARVTHWLEETGNLPGTQYLAGHKQTSTTAGYVRPSLRAALDVLDASKKKRRKRAG